MADDSYNGWTNRETWAVSLYIDNDEGWYTEVRDILRPYVASEEHDADIWAASNELRDFIEQWLTVAGYREYTAEESLPASLSVIAEDIGSLYRVNWDEVASNILSDLNEAAPLGPVAEES